MKSGVALGWEGVPGGWYRLAGGWKRLMGGRGLSGEVVGGGRDASGSEPSLVALTRAERREAF